MKLTIVVCVENNYIVADFAVNEIEIAIFFTIFQVIKQTLKEI